MIKLQILEIRTGGIYMFDKMLDKKRKKQRKKVQQEQYEQICKDFLCIKPDDITYLVQYKQQEYIIYINADDELDWETSANIISKIENNPEINKTMVEVNILRHKPQVMQLDRKSHQHFQCLLGNILICALEENMDMVPLVKQEAIAYLNQKELEITRKWYVSFSFLFLLTFTVAFFVLKYI